MPNIRFNSAGHRRIFGYNQKSLQSTILIVSAGSDEVVRLKKDADKFDSYIEELKKFLQRSQNEVIFRSSDLSLIEEIKGRFAKFTNFKVEESKFRATKLKIVEQEENSIEIVFFTPPVIEVAPKVTGERKFVVVSAAQIKADAELQEEVRKRWKHKNKPSPHFFSNPVKKELDGSMEAVIKRLREKADSIKEVTLETVIARLRKKADNVVVKEITPSL